MNQDQIPTIGEYRGVPIHDFQSAERVETVVRPAIDHVLTLSDIGALFDYAANNHNPPEARLFAAAKARACHDIASSSRTLRPDVDLKLLDAHVAGLDSLDWTSPDLYGSDCDPRPGAEPRPPEFRVALERAQRIAKDGGAP